MKKLTSILICAALSLPVTGMAQQHSSKLKHDVKEVADTISNNTKEAAAKGVAKITDKTYADKVGPHGETIYINKHSKYYYIDGKGKKIYLTKSKMKDNLKR